MSCAGTKVNILVEAANAAAIPATPPLQVRRLITDVAFPASSPYDGVVKGRNMPDPSKLTDTSKENYLPASSPYVADPN